MLLILHLTALIILVAYNVATYATLQGINL